MSLDQIANIAEIFGALLVVIGVLFAVVEIRHLHVAGTAGCGYASQHHAGVHRPYGLPKNCPIWSRPATNGGHGTGQLAGVEAPHGMAPREARPPFRSRVVSMAERDPLHRDGQFAMWRGVLL